MEFRDGKVVHETQYFAEPFPAPAWRSDVVSVMRARPILNGSAASKASVHEPLAGSGSGAGAIEEAAMAATMHATAEASMAR